MREDRKVRAVLKQSYYFPYLFMFKEILKAKYKNTICSSKP